MARADRVVRRVAAQLARRARGQLPFLAVLAVMVAGVVYLSVQPAHWRRASTIIAVSMILGAALRLVLSDNHAGMLAVRNRWLDIACYLGTGVLILIVAIRLG